MSKWDLSPDAAADKGWNHHASQRRTAHPTIASNNGPVSQGSGRSDECELRLLPPVATGESRYAVVRDGKTLGRVTKIHDSFMTKFPWRTWAGPTAPGAYLGEFNTWKDSVKALERYANEN